MNLELSLPELQQLQERDSSEMVALFTPGAQGAHAWRLGDVIVLVHQGTVHFTARLLTWVKV